MNAPQHTPARLGTRLGTRTVGALSVRERVIPIPPPLIPVFEEAWQHQQEKRAAAGDGWEDNDLVFCRPDGRPLDPRDDWEEFKELLNEAGIDDRRVHDGRHSAGTILNELGVDIRTIMEILGHTQTQHDPPLRPRHHAVDGGGGTSDGRRALAEN